MEQTFQFDHLGYTVDVTVWNKTSVEQPLVLFDFNNVLNAYELDFLQQQSNTQNQPYAIVSLLVGKGKNFQSLKQRALDTGECIVALTCKTTGGKLGRHQFEQGVKLRVMIILNWHKAMVALDDKPHEWLPRGAPLPKPLKLDPSKKPIYKVFLP